MRGADSAAPIERITATAATIPTEAPEEDGTLAWDSTTLVLVEIDAGGRSGLGYSYTSSGAITVIEEALAPRLLGSDALDSPARWSEMVRVVRNIGRQGIAACAISALDTALWDLKGKLFERPVTQVLGRAREQAAVYGSGGFTNLVGEALADHVAATEEKLGCAWVKIKIGARPHQDIERLDVALAALKRAKLMVDANGALTPAEAIDAADQCAKRGIVWFEEPVSSDDLWGLRRVRDAARPPVAISAGEYGYDPWYFHTLLNAGAVDVVQADATRCLGFTGFLKVAALAEAANTPLSTHCAASLHLPVALAAPGLMHVEWFYDHARIEGRVFEGAPAPDDGWIRTDESKPGLGLTLRRPDLEEMSERLRSKTWEA